MFCQIQQFFPLATANKPFYCKLTLERFVGHRTLKELLDRTNTFMEATNLPRSSCSSVPKPHTFIVPYHQKNDRGGLRCNLTRSYASQPNPHVQNHCVLKCSFQIAGHFPTNECGGYGVTTHVRTSHIVDKGCSQRMG